MLAAMLRVSALLELSRTTEAVGVGHTGDKLSPAAEIPSEMRVAAAAGAATAAAAEAAAAEAAVEAAGAGAAAGAGGSAATAEVAEAAAAAAAAAAEAVAVAVAEETEAAAEAVPRMTAAEALRALDMAALLAGTSTFMTNCVKSLIDFATLRL